ncbi:MAG: PP2C family protein-serine/threonine phosphatase [Bacteroidota bacterium]
MSKFSELRKGLSSLETLERELHLKQLQINRLLTITQAINDNVSAEGLYKMYNSFLSWEMGVKKMALFVKQGEHWNCTSHIGLDESISSLDISDKLPKYQRLRNIDEDKEHPLIKEFDIVIPVLHKQSPIAYTFIGGFDEHEDMYGKVQFITTITNVIAVAIENKRLFKRQLEQERLKREMELAREMQHMLIPSQLPKGNHYELASIYKPHLGVGGDYFDFTELEENKFAFCIADISGKGIAAALLMANFQANFHGLIHQRTNLDDFIRELNQSLFRITKGDKFLTFFVAEFDLATRELRYVNAGHNPPCLAIDGQLHALDKGCTILGSFKELPGVEIGRLELIEEATIVTFTDGLTDLQAENGEYFDEQMLQDFVREHQTFSAKVFNDRLLRHIEQFKGDQTYPDDFTVLTCKIFSRD